MPLTVTPITDDFAVSGQLEETDLAEASRLGFRSIINNRPDGEGGPAQPSQDALRKQAEAHGLHYAYLPIAPAYVGQDAVDATRRLLRELPRPILAFCRSGARSTLLFHAAMAHAQGGGSA
jgi:uncharacterized protein (TIGR01244 family)